MAMELSKALELVHMTLDSEHPANTAQGELLRKEENINRIAQVFINNGEDDYDGVMAEIGKIVAENGGEETNAFGGDAEEQTTGKQKRTRRTNTVANTTSRVVAAEASKIAATNYGKCAALVSKLGAICAYITATPEHFSIGKTSKTDARGVTKTNFGVKFNPAGAVKGTMLALPLKAIQEVRKYTTDSNADMGVCNVAEAQDPKQPYVLEFHTPSNFLEVFLASEACGSIREAEELWDPYVVRRYNNAKKSHDIIAYPDVAAVEAMPGNECVDAGKNAVVLSLGYKRADDGTQSLYPRAKHTVRARLQAPGNYIAARSYATIEIKAAYPADELDSLNAAYLSRFSTMKYKNQPLLQSAAEDPNITTTVDQTTTNMVITASNFFTSNSAASAFNTPVDHWYSKTEDGKPLQVNPIGKQLVKREVYKTKSEKQASRIVYAELAAVQNDAKTAYVPTFDANGSHPKIGAAVSKFGLQVDLNALLDFLKTNNILRSKSAKGGGKAKPTKPMGNQAFGYRSVLKSDSLTQALAAIKA